MKRFTFSLMALSLCAALQGAPWYAYPQAPGLQVSGTGTGARCDIADGTPNGAFYTYRTVVPGRRYALRGRVRIEGGIAGANARLRGTLCFRQQTGRFTEGAAYWPLTPPETEFQQEFVVPAGCDRIRILPVAAENRSGVFTVSDLSCEPVKDTFDSPEKLTGFYVSGTPAKRRTSVKVNSDGKTLRFTVRCEEPSPEKLKRGVRPNDSPIWSDDDVELFLVPPSGRIFQFILNPDGARWEGEHLIRVPGDPPAPDTAWNGAWQGRAVVGRDHWTAEFSIPFNTLGAQANGVWRFNVLCGRRGALTELSQFGAHTHEFKNANFFSTLKFAPDGRSWQVIRSRIPAAASKLTVTRPAVSAAALPTVKDRRVVVGGAEGSSRLSSYSRTYQKANQSGWAAREDRILNELAQAGIIYQRSLPWFVQESGGAERCLERLKKYRVGLRYAMHNTSFDRESLNHGAKYAFGTTGNAVNAIDPAMHDVMFRHLAGVMKRMPWVRPYLKLVRGFDEPCNNLYNVFSVSHNPRRAAELAEADRAIRRETGYGRYGLVDHFAANTDADAPMCRIAFFRWWNRRFAGELRRDREFARREFPGVPFLGATINTVGNFRGLVRIPEIAGHADLFGVDPYPTAVLADYSRERALYHTGFCTKVLHDLAKPARAYVYIQAFRYRGRTPSPAELREWTAQALKNGADQIDWYANGNLEDCPETYREMVRLSREISRMDKLQTPERSRTAILYSFIHQWGSFDHIAHSTYTLYSVLGEHLGAWFNFVSDWQLDRQAGALDGVKLLFVPSLTFCTEKTARVLTAFVRRGGTLVLLDPKALSRLPDGTDPAALRRELLGERQSGKTTGELACRKLGAGKVYQFVRQPFADSSLAAKPGAIQATFARLLREAGEPMNLPVWRFEFPPPAGK